MIIKLQNKLNKIYDEKQIDNSSKNKLSDLTKKANDLKAKIDLLMDIKKIRE